MFVARVLGRMLFPARFQLVAAMNLCPCGARGDPALECACTPQRLARYRERFSRALLDRCDLVVMMPRPRAAELAAPPGESSATVRERVIAARAELAPSGLRALTTRRATCSRGRSSGSRCRGAAAPGLRASPATIAALAGRARGRGRARRRGALLPSARRGGRMSELACAAFAAATGSHLVDEPRSARYAAFRRGVRRAGVPRRAGAKRAIRWIGRSDPEFPPLLRAIHDPPPGLFLRGAGDASLLARTSVAVVGARACSSYGTAVASSFARRLAESGVIVVSGLARGVDAAAHRGALEAGVTVAVLGLRRRSRLSALARRARRADRRARADRLRVPAGRRAGTVALPGAKPDRRRSLPRDGRRRGASA